MSGAVLGKARAVAQPALHAVPATGGVLAVLKHPPAEKGSVRR